jgi:hypothetical protein
MGISGVGKMIDISPWKCEKYFYTIEKIEQQSRLGNKDGNSGDGVRKSCER